MSDAALEQLIALTGVLTEAVTTVVSTQAAQGAALGSQAQSIKALGLLAGLTYLATKPTTPLPADVLEDPALELFLAHYPLDGPPIIGKEKMDVLIESFANLTPVQLVHAFSAPEKAPGLTVVERIRNAQLEHHFREKIATLEQSLSDPSPLQTPDRSD
jgi:hypothetical protein